MATNNPTFANPYAQQQSIINALMQQSLTPKQGQFVQNGVGTFYTGPGIADALARVAGAVVSEKAQKDLNTQYNTDTKKGLEEYEAIRAGKPAQFAPSLAPTIGNDPANPQQVQTAAAVPGDPRKAATYAITSGLPTLRDIGMSDLKELAKQGISMKDLLPYANPEAIPDMVTKGLSGFKAKSELGEVDGIVYDKNRREVVQLNGPQPTLRTIEGDLYQQSPSTGGHKKLDNAPKINVSVTNKGDDAFMKTYGTKVAENVVAAQQAKVNALKTNAMVGQLEALDRKGVFSGPTAGAATTLGAFAQTIGLPVDVNKLANSQEYQATLHKQVSQYLTSGAGVGRSLTDADRKVLESQFPQLIATPEGRQQIFGMLRRAAAADINHADDIQKNLQRWKPEAAPLFNLTPAEQPYQIPSAPAAPSSGFKIIGVRPAGR